MDICSLSPTYYPIENMCFQSNDTAIEYIDINQPPSSFWPLAFCSITYLASIVFCSISVLFEDTSPSVSNNTKMIDATRSNEENNYDFTHLDEKKLSSKKHLYIVIAAVISFVVVSFLFAAVAGWLLAIGSISIDAAYGILAGGIAAGVAGGSYFTIRHGNLEEKRRYMNKHPAIPNLENYKDEKGNINKEEFHKDLRLWLKNGTDYIPELVAQEDFDESIGNFITENQKDKLLADVLGEHSLPKLHLNGNCLNLSIENSKQDEILKQLALKIRIAMNKGSLADQQIQTILFSTHDHGFHTFKNNICKQLGKTLKLEDANSITFYPRERENKKEVQLWAHGDLIQTSTTQTYELALINDNKPVKLSSCRLTMDAEFFIRNDGSIKNTRFTHRFQLDTSQN